MIFAHGPLGFITALGSRRVWKPQQASKKIENLFLLIGFIGGIFPDIDLFYYYFGNATQSHRALITHTPIVYITLLLLVGIVTQFSRKNPWFVGTFVFVGGTLSHLLTDMVGSQIRFFYPLSHQFFGLSRIHSEVIQGNLFYLNFLMEGVWFFFFFYILVRMFVQHIPIRIGLVVALIICFTAGVGVLTMVNTHVYHGKNLLVLNDADNDGIENIRDQDIDGDGQPNTSDLDSDNDGRGNVQEIAENSNNFEGVWYDKTEGGFIEIPARVGFVRNVDMPFRLYHTAGIFLETEMQNDYRQNPQGYVSAATAPTFSDTPKNLSTYLEHQGKLEMGQQLADGRNQIGDILFFPNDYLAVITGFTNESQALVLDTNSTSGVHEKLLNELIQERGQPVARGKILDARATFNSQ